MKNKTCNAREHGCVAVAAHIIGSKWMPQLIYVLANGVHRFSEIQKEIDGINPRTLSSRLDELESAEIVTKECFKELPPRIEYTLTPKGKDLLPILEEMVDWGTKYSK